MQAFLLSFALIFVAELGDKSQLVALWFATQYRWWLVITGVTVATLVVHLASTAIGATAADLLPQAVVLTVVGLSFYGFAVWGLLGDTLEERESRPSESVLKALSVVTLAFFLSELGDKTQLATVSLGGSEGDFLGVWLGSTFGMVAADALAIVVGVIAGGRIPERLVARLAAALFFLFGTLSLVQATRLALN